MKKESLEQEIKRLANARADSLQSPLRFLSHVYNLHAQRVKPEYETRFNLGKKLIGKDWDNFCKSVHAYWFEEYRHGLDITWQQTLALIGIEKAMRGECVARISIVSGHGVGKSTLLAWLILWFLFVNMESQVACTSPGAEQMYDVLWKELKKWIDLMPEEYARFYVWESSHIRMKDFEQTWFARAKTSSKENTEALAGIHAEWVLMAVDEACHDDQTEVLTDDGWKLFKELTKKNMVMTLDSERGSAWQRPTHYHEYDHDGEMVASNLQAADFMVTSNHDIYGKTRDSGYRKVKAGNLNGTDLFVPRIIKWEGIETVSDDEMRLAGWFVSEGSFKKYKNGKVNAIVISQSKEKNPENHAEIVDLLERLGYNPLLQKNDIVVKNVTLANSMLKFGDGFKNKHIPQEYREQSPRLLNIFLDAFVRGDGYRHDSRDILYTSSESLANDLQEVILKTGFNSTITKRKIQGQRKYIKDHWAVSSCDGYVVSRTFNDSHMKLNHKKVKSVQYKGKVYCVTVPNGIIMTRRNGCAMWSGNSGVEEPIFETMEGALTSGNTLVFLISNGTRSIGYFYDSHHKDSQRWQNYAFDSEESPRVDKKYVDSIIAKYGKDSVQYKIRVKGEFPDEGIMDDKGWVQLFNKADLHIVPHDHDWRPIPRVFGALDPSGEGQDSSEWAVRDRIRAGIVASEKVSTPASLAQRSLTVCDAFRVYPSDFTVDAFGKGHPVAAEIAIATAHPPFTEPWRVHPINTGEPCDNENDRELYVNIRAMLFYRMLLWCRSGGEIMASPGLEDELLSIRFKRTGTGRIQIMDKVSMKKLGFKSPNKADALSMTFYRPDETIISDDERARRADRTDSFDPHAAVE